MTHGDGRHIYLPHGSQVPSAAGGHFTHRPQGRLRAEGANVRPRKAVRLGDQLIEVGCVQLVGGGGEQGL